jgi:hypothetical protein
LENLPVDFELPRKCKIWKENEEFGQLDDSNTPIRSVRLGYAHSRERLLWFSSLVAEGFLDELRKLLEAESLQFEEAAKAVGSTVPEKTKWKIVTSFDDPDTEGQKVPTPGSFLKDGLLLEHGRFGKHEVEKAAELLVRFLDDARSCNWREFTLEEFSKFCTSVGEHSLGAGLYGLICPWWDDGKPEKLRENAGPPYIVQTDLHHFAITTAFIDRLKLKKK